MSYHFFDFFGKGFVKLPCQIVWYNTNGIALYVYCRTSHNLKDLLQNLKLCMQKYSKTTINTRASDEANKVIKKNIEIFYLRDLL